MPLIGEDICSKCPVPAHILFIGCLIRIQRRVRLIIARTSSPDIFPVLIAGNIPLGCGHIITSIFLQILVSYIGQVLPVFLQMTGTKRNMLCRINIPAESAISIFGISPGIIKLQLPLQPGISGLDG